MLKPNSPLSNHDFEIHYKETMLLIKVGPGLMEEHIYLQSGN